MTLRAAMLFLALSGSAQDRLGDWIEKTRAIRPGWGRAEVEEFLKNIRVASPHRPAYLNGGGFSRGKDPMTYFNVYSLDETYSLYLVWKSDDPARGIRSTEIVTFSDLKGRVDPALFDAIAAIHRSPSAQQGLAFDPVPLIRAVNALLPMGKERALKALRAYARLARDASSEDVHKHGLDEYRILPIALLLFEGMPGYRIGAGDVDPDLPVVVVQDVPFMLVSGYTVEGKPPDPAEYLKQATGALRAAPLAPRGLPPEAADELVRSPLWKKLSLGAGSEGRKKWQMRRQALEAASTVFSLRPDETTSDCCADPTETQWRAAADRAREAGIVWSPEIQDFILGR
jgi:hypothetical protein